MTALGLHWVIPAGTPSRECRGCGYTVWWVTLPSGKTIPVDTRAEGCEAPGRAISGLGVAHWASCPRATDHHRRAAAQAHVPLPADLTPTEGGAA